MHLTVEQGQQPGIYTSTCLAVNRHLNDAKGVATIHQNEFQGQQPGIYSINKSKRCEGGRYIKTNFKGSNQTSKYKAGVALGHTNLKEEEKATRQLNVEQGYQPDIKKKQGWQVPFGWGMFRLNPKHETARQSFYVCPNMSHQEWDNKQPLES